MMWVYSEKFSNGLLSGYTFFCLDLDDFCFSFEYWAVSWECLVVISAVAASDFGVCALIFVVSLAAAPCTRRYRFIAYFHCVSVSKTCLAARWSFVILENFSFCLFSGISMNLGGSFSLKVSRSGVKARFLVFIHVDFFTSRRFYSFFSSLP